ncbi:helicase-exonuclease AddAB subunit AddB [Clostridium oryzae]|uniref:ATP-dependent helicase/deoxyribonuclease subunit B n=1 Tax=Clostridium oryzae TaxID=1450648 RepID=A0A1V4ICA2_9CLOT|nr:helicase-exonuclease AddAB subunit AddB [Clostridium oryzae]OPJ57484.1 ATP-dependent helicase/deoxyribonuclease subunit B [Clostridium oryzae]
MSLRFIYGRAGCGKSRYCLDEIKKSMDRGDQNKLIMLIPEQYSFQAEKNMLNMLGVTHITKAEVLSFKRLCYRVFNEVGGITLKKINDIGKLMLIYEVIEELKDDLSIFNKSSKQQGFVDIISDTIKEFKRYNISPEILEHSSESIENDELKLKLLDLKKIYGAFEQKLHEKYIDAEDELTILAEKIDKSNLYNNAEIWIDEFSTFTPQQYLIIEKLLKKCKRVNITLNCDELRGNSDNTDIFYTVKNTERRILRLAEKNNVAFEKPVDLNQNCCQRFDGAEELKHLEMYFFSYPYRYYNKDINRIKLYKAQNRYEEMEVVARNIISLVRDKKYRYRDIAVVCREIDDYEKLISVIFSEYGIPYFMDKRREITDNPLVVFINSLFDIFIKNWSYESVFRYLKTGILNIEKDDVDVIENYVLANGIKGNTWFKEQWEFKINYDADETEKTAYEIEKLQKVNEIKKYISDPIIKLYKDIKGRKNIRSICGSLYNFLVDVNALNVINDWSRYFKDKGEIENSNKYAQIIDVVIDTLDEMVEIMGEEAVNIDKFSKLLNFGFEKHEMGLIPVSLDEVIIGDIARIRSHGVKALYIIGTNDGVFPRVSREEGILSDRDRNQLKENGLELAPDTKIQAFDEQFLVYTTLTTASDYLMITYPMADFEGKAIRPSSIISKIKKIFPKIVEKSQLANEANILDTVASPGPTFNEMVTELRRNHEGKEVNEVWSSIYKWYNDKPEWKNKAETIFKGLYYTNEAKEIDREKIKTLYGKPLKMSVSRIEQYARCPFAYYIKFGLKAKDRKIYEFSSPDLGSFIHTILDKFSETIKLEDMKWKEIDNNWCKEAIDLLVDKELNSRNNFILNSSAKYKYMTAKLKRILTRSVSVITEHIKRSSFEPISNELAFGTKGKLPPMILNLPSGETVELIGRIDRVDSMDLDEQTYFRVIDYKSGNKVFSLSEVYFGLQLQLLVYIDALVTNAEYYIHKQALPGAILYFKVDDPLVNGYPNMSQEEIENEILKKLKMNGLILKDARVVKSMDSGIEGYSLIIPARMNKGDTLGNTNSVVTLEQFDILRKYVRDTLVRLCEEMLSGNISIKPIKENSDTACNFCNFSSICQFDPSLIDNNYKTIDRKSDEEVWGLMEQKVKVGENSGTEQVD